MPTLQIMAIVKRLGGGKTWSTRTFGPEGFVADERTDLNSARRIIVTYGPYDNTTDHIVHASISYRDENTMPTYDDLQLLHRAVWPNGHAYQVFVPPTEHVNIHGSALHLWGRLDGSRMLPAFALNGSV